MCLLARILTPYFNYYDYDPLQLKIYHDSAGDDGNFQQYLEKYVFGVKNHVEYLRCVGGKSPVRYPESRPVLRIQS